MKEQVNFEKLKNRTPLIIVLTVSLFLLSGSNWDGITISGYKHLSNYSFDPQSALIERIRPIPESILTVFKELDGRKDYAPYMPGPNETALIAAVLETLPPLNIKIMKERLTAIYFVSNFSSAGCSDWLVNEYNEIYAYIIINPAALKTSINELLTWKEKSCFIDDNSGFEIKVNVSPDQKGFLYIMLHESCHVVDYVLGITPFTEPDIKLLREISQETNFTRGIWLSYNQSSVYYESRKRLTFYQNPQIKISDAESIYRDMSASPFISLYGSLNWAEDLCEFLAFYHLTEKMGMNYRIEVQRKGKTSYFEEPARRKQVRERFKNLKVFYESS